MLKYLKKYKNQFDDQLNKDLMTKAHDGELTDYIIDVWKSLEVAPPIKIIGTSFSNKESEIDINKFIYKRDKKVRKKDRYNSKFISDSRCGTLTVDVEISLPVKNPKTEVVEIHKTILKKSMLIPLIDNKGYYHINGQKYHLIYQLVEKSTYTGKQTVTLKSLMPIAVSRTSVGAVGMLPTELPLVDTMTLEDGTFAKKATVVKEDVNHVSYTLPVYNIYMFRKEIPVIVFYLANGLDWALDFLGVNSMISFEHNMDDRRSDEVWFQISSKCFLRVKHKSLFDKYPYIQSIVGGILKVVTNRFTPISVMDNNIWIKKLGGDGANNLAKGNDMLIFFNRLLDETTRKILKIDDYNKKDIYALIRWIMMNFNELRLKDNMDLTNKRIRCNEYIASLLTIEFSRRLNRVIAMGNKATIDNYKEIFKFSGDILIRKLHASGVLRFDANINDMTFFSKFKVTSKGPHSLGNKDSNRISMKARGIHPSYLGFIDILVCGNSDPGTSALLSPWTRMDDMYFDNSIEEDHFLYEFKTDLSNLEWENMKDNTSFTKLEIDTKDKQRYFEILAYMSDMNDSTTVYGVSGDMNTVIVDAGVEDIDEKKAEKIQ